MQGHLQWRKGVHTLKENVYVTSRGRYCPEHPELIYVSAAATHLTLPNKSYGLDILARIGYQRDSRQMTMVQIKEDLPRHIRVSERHLRTLYQEYLALLACAERLDVAALKEAAQKYGGLILSIDGLEPEGGQPQLWVVREVLTNTVLAAGWIPRVDEPTLTAFLAPVKALDLPWLATVSDKQVSLIKALAATWEKIPHQYCQAHYLSNAVTPMYEADEHLKTQLRKQIRAKAGVTMRQTQAEAKKQKVDDDKPGLVTTGLAVKPPPGLEEVRAAAQEASAAEKELQPAPSLSEETVYQTVDEVLTAYAGSDKIVLSRSAKSQAQAVPVEGQTEPVSPLTRQQSIDQLVEAYAARLRNVLSRRGRKPFRLAGLRLFSDLLALQTSLENSLVHLPNEPRLTCFVEAIRETLLAFEEDYLTLAEGYNWVLDISTILDKELPQAGADALDEPLSAAVQTELNQYLTHLEQRSDLNHTLLAFRGHLRRLTTRYAPGLFHCYDIPGLPRTNNDTEALFGRVRRQTKRTSGAYHAKQRLHEQGAWLLFDLMGDEDEQLQRLQQVPLAQWRDERQRMQAHLLSFCNDRRFRKQPVAYLTQLETQAAAITSLN
ncbi:MAG: DUF3987 domain-containing protein [bacterium]|nr:DUF3987 domain-containing protein [bacterium]